MSWAEFLTLMLESTSKVEKAAIFNTKGQPLATTEDLQISEADGRALLHCLRDPARCLTRITFDGMDFRCFQGNSSVLVGKATSDTRRILVAHLTDDALVVVVGNSTGHGSFLYEVQYHLEERARRELLRVQNDAGRASNGAREANKTDKKTSLPSPIVPPSQPRSGNAGHSEVLVQLQD